MNLSEYFKRQFSYDDWANREVIAAIRNSDADDARSLQLLSHIFSAERLWLERMQRVPQTLAVWPDSDLRWCERQANELAREWPLFISGVSDLDEIIQYKNSKGEPWSSTIQDILNHVVMHSAYHRGQIASHMRASGFNPAYTDFIHAVRQGQVK